MAMTLQEQGIITLGTLQIDPSGYRATVAGEPLDLTRSELEVLALLVTNRRRVISRAELSSALGLIAARSVDVILSSLRHKLNPGFVRNVRNRGWILEPSVFGA